MTLRRDPLLLQNYKILQKRRQYYHSEFKSIRWE